MMKALIGIAVSVLIASSAYAFDVDLVTPSVPELSTMVYANVTGEVDSLDDSVFHLSVKLTDGLQALLGGGDRFGMTGFWFNTAGPIEPESITLIPPAIQWVVQLNNPNCPGGCSARGSKFGEYLHKILWRGPIDQRPERLDIDFDMPGPVLDTDFMVLSTAKPESNQLGHFVVHIDGFRLLTGGMQVGGTFVRD